MRPFSRDRRMLASHALSGAAGFPVSPAAPLRVGRAQAGVLSAPGGSCARKSPNFSLVTERGGDALPVHSIGGDQHDDRLVRGGCFIRQL
jgi:hypothetical protein